MDWEATAHPWGGEQILRVLSEEGREIRKGTGRFKGSSCVPVPGRLPEISGSLTQSPKASERLPRPLCGPWALGELRRAELRPG